jgi:hypothetical protein
MADDNRRFSGGFLKGYITTVYKNLRTDFGYIYIYIYIYITLWFSKNLRTGQIALYQAAHFFAGYFMKMSGSLIPPPQQKKFNKLRFFDSEILFSSKKTRMRGFFLFPKIQKKRK